MAKKVKKIRDFSGELEKFSIEIMENDCKVVALQTPFDTRRVQCVGVNFVKYLATIHYGESENLSNSSSEEKISDSQTEFSVDVNYLRSLDPKEWKDQDHYAVLGLKHLR